ncbi:MAG TPA: hypothetical protein VF598_07565, partial [Hymenobacter sp.]
LAEHLTQASQVLASIGRQNMTLEDVARSLTSYYKVQLYDRRKQTQWLTVDEEKLYQLAKTLQEEGKLADFPQRVTS